MFQTRALLRASRVSALTPPHAQPAQRTCLFAIGLWRGGARCRGREGGVGICEPRDRVLAQQERALARSATPRGRCYSFERAAALMRRFDFCELTLSGGAGSAALCGEGATAAGFSGAGKQQEASA